MDEPTKQRLLDEMFQTWMREQLQNSPVSVPGSDTLAVAAQPVPPPTAAAIPMNQAAIAKDAVAKPKTPPTAPPPAPESSPTAASQPPTSDPASDKSDPWS